MAKARPQAERKNEQNRSRAAGAPSAGAHGAETRQSTPGTADRWTALEWGAFAGLCLLLFYPPYFRGLFFPKEQLITLIITLVVFMLWWVARWRRGDAVLLQEPLDYVALALVGAYVLSLFIAVNPRAAIQEVLKNLNYFLIYWLVSRTAREAGGLRIGPFRFSPLRIILNVMLASAVGVAVVGVGVAAGTFQYNGAFDGLRISSTLQYPNTLAAYLTAAFFLALALALEAERRWLRFLYAAAAQALFLPFVLTYSRGAWLAFPIVTLVFILMLPRSKRLPGLLMLGAVAPPAAIGIPLFLKGLSAKQATTIWAGYGASTIVAAMLTPLAGWLAALPRRVPGKVRFAALAAAAATVIAAAWFGAALVAARPLAAQGAGQTAPPRHYSELVWGLQRDAEHILSFEVSAAGPTDKEAWRVSIDGYNPDGQLTSLGNLTGNPEAGWTTREVKFKTRAGGGRVVVRLAATPPEATATFRNVRLIEPDGASRHLSFFWAKALPQAVLDRLLSITTGDFSAVQRGYFNRDALKIVRDYPVLGAGGGGWAALYFKYQSFAYFTTQVHNHLMQTWVETGTVGLLTLLGLWTTFAYAWWRARRAFPAHAILLAGTCAIALALTGHSLIDFNLSLSAVGFFLWAAMGVSGAVRWQADAAGQVAMSSRRTALVRPASQRFWGIACLTTVAALAAGAGALLAGVTYGAEGARALTGGNAAQAQTLFARAIQWDPWTPTFHLDLAQAEEILARNADDASASANRSRLLANADAHMRRGLQLDSFNPQFRTIYGSFLLRTGRLAEGVGALETALALQPFEFRRYENLAGAYFEVVRHLIERSDRSEDRQQAQVYLARLAALPQRVAAQRAKQPEDVLSYMNMPERTALFALSVGKGLALVKQPEQARSFLDTSSKDQATQAEALLWLAALAEREGNATKRGELLGQALKLRGQLQQEWPRVLQLLQRA